MTVVDADVSQVLGSSSSSTEAALGALLNELNGLSRDLLLVLDDYHLIEAPEVHDGLTFVLAHQPPRCTWCSRLAPIPHSPDTDAGRGLS